MAETPFTPESGTVSSGAVPEAGTQGSSVQSPAGESPAPAPAAVESSEPPAAVDPVATEPAASEAVIAQPVSAPVSPVQPAAEPAALESAAGGEPAVETAAVGSVQDAGDSAVPMKSSSSAAAEPASQPPGVAATITVPPLEGAEAGGGEWELLVERFSTWWNSGELTRQWQRIRGPLKGVAILVAVLVALQVYATAVRTIDGIPLVSGLLELTGLIAVLQFSSRRLLRSSDRQEVLAQVQRRWLDFRGRN